MGLGESLSTLRKCFHQRLTSEISHNAPCSLPTHTFIHPPQNYHSVWKSLSVSEAEFQINLPNVFIPLLHSQVSGRIYESTYVRTTEDVASFRLMKDVVRCINTEQNTRAIWLHYYTSLLNIIFVSVCFTLHCPNSLQFLQDKAYKILVAKPEGKRPFG